MNEMFELVLWMLVAIVTVGFVIWFIDEPVDSCKKLYRFCKELISRILPNTQGVTRLCVVVSILFVFITFIEIPVNSGIGQIVCGKRSCNIFGEPSWITAVIAFCVPFVVAKIIEFIISGFKE